MAEVLFVSKPIEAPWRDSSKNLVRDVASALEVHTPVVMARPSSETGLLKSEPVYGEGAAAFAPALADNARVLWHLMTKARAQLWHFFFAPNKKSALAGATARRVRGVPCVQTVCSAPASEVDPKSVLFADKTVVLSRATHQRFVDAGVEGDRLALIGPCIAPLSASDVAGPQATRERYGLGVADRVWLYPGDLEFGKGATHSIAALSRADDTRTRLVVASRPKTPAAQDALRVLKQEALQAGVADRITWLGEIEDIHALLRAVDVVVLPTDTLYAKMDYPLVLLEAMMLGTPVVVAPGTPAQELADAGAAIASDPRPEALESAVTGLLTAESRRATLTERADRWVRQTCAPAAVAAQYEALYDQLLS